MRQKSRLGIKSGIQQEAEASPSLAAALPTLPLSTTSRQDALLLHSDPSSPVATAAPTAATAVPTALLAAPALLSTVSTSSRQQSVAQRVPASGHVGSNLIPQLERIIGPASRRAPHLAGTRVKIFCSQAGRGLKSSRSLSQASGQDASVRRVKRRLEAVNQMIWRCECADTAITKGQPIAPSALNAADAAKHLPLALPLAGTTVSRVAAHLGIAPAPQLVPAHHSSSSSILAGSDQLPATSPAATQLPADQQLLHGASSSQPLHPAMTQPDESDLIHQLPGSASMLLDDNTAMLSSSQTPAVPVNSAPPSSEPQPRHAGQTDTQPDSLLRTDAAQNTAPHSRHISPRPSSCSPSGSLLGLSTSRQASPSSASLAELVPSTTAVTVPPYNVISAARASSAEALTAPVVLLDDAAVSVSEAQNSWCGQEVALAVRLGLKGQQSVGVPDTPDQEHLVLNRERSSLSKDQAEALAPSSYVQSDLGLDRKSNLSASGMIDLAMSDAPPGEIEPEMFAFLLDSDAFGSQKSDDPSALQG